MADVQESPHFLEYVALLRQLRGLISDGKGESEEADRLRDRMDAPWFQLTADEIARIDTLATDVEGGKVPGAVFEQESHREA
jgi:hypothetical protein